MPSPSQPKNGKADRQHETDLVDRMMHQDAARRSDQRHQHGRCYAMRQAQARQADGQPIKPMTASCNFRHDSESIPATGFANDMIQMKIQHIISQIMRGAKDGSENDLWASL